jgi:hypothetical protein
MRIFVRKDVMRLAKVRKKTDKKADMAEMKEPVAVEEGEEAALAGNVDVSESNSDVFDSDGWSPEDIPPPRRPRRPKTEAGREKQMVALAVDLAEQQLRDGTASAQVITHYLKLGTEREKLERAILKEQRDLITEKTKALKSAAHMEELYAQAIEAMKTYGGGGE